MFAVPSFFGYNTTFVSTPVATAATGVGETSFTANWNAFAGAEYYLLDVSTSPSFSSFVFQDQVVLAPTTSYVVIGLTASTTYYYRLRASTDPYFDPDAAAFFARVTAAGGALTTTEQNATNQLVLDMKAAGIWTAMKAVYPMVGASAAACAQNLKSSSFTGTFTSGWTFASTGATPNGTSAYMNTGLNPNTSLSLNSTHLSYYSRTNISANQVDMGCVNVTNGCYLIFNFSGVGYASINDSESQRTSAANPSTGFLIGSRNSSSQEKYFTNNVAQTRTSNSTTVPSVNIVLSGYNRGAGIIQYYNTKQCAFASIGDGLTDTQASNFYTAVQAFQVTLSRSV
jgi:hypothetical protein